MHPTATRPRGRKKWLWLAAGALLLGVLAALVWPTGEETLIVNGVPFRVWVAQHPDFQIREPHVAIGTNAIPHFLNILRERPQSSRVYQTKAWLWKQLPTRLQARFYRWYPVPTWQLQRTALFGLRFLGPEAKAALPAILQFGKGETNRMVRAGALVAALQIAPENPETFNFWRAEWYGTNFSRPDLAVYLRAARYPLTNAAPLLLAEAQGQARPVVFLEAFEYLGEAARPAVPQMVRLVADETFQANMTTLLRRLGPVAVEAVPTMIELLNNKDATRTAAALLVLKAIGDAARPAVPRIQTLTSHQDSTVRMLAVATLARLEGNPESAVPVLLEVLEGKVPRSGNTYVPVDIRQEMAGLVASGSQAAALLLGELGPAAPAALPALEAKLADRNEVTRVLVAQAIWRISRNPKPVLPVLLAVLDTQESPPPGSVPDSTGFALVLAIETIEEMGGAAREAIPTLERVRLLSMLARRAANRAIAGINAPPR